MITLVDFLLARIAEEEQAARLAIDGQADPENGWGYEGRALTPHVGIIHHAVQADHIIRWHPARVLAECEAKRRIVDHEDARGAQSIVSFTGRVVRAVGTSGVLRCLALPYSDHPDFDGPWQP